MNVRTVFPSKWLNAEDLGNRRVEVIIAGATMEDVHNRETNNREQKLAVAFEKATKKLLVNKTQAFAMASVAGSDETDDWKGTRISMHVGRARNGKATIVIEAAAVQPPAAAMDSGEDGDAGDATE